MTNLDTLIQDLVIANRILAKEDVVDAYGHVSVRHPDNPKHFFISRSLAPELIEKDDIVELDLDGQPVKDEKRSLYLERFIHAAIYRGAAGGQCPSCTPTPRISCRSASPRRPTLRPVIHSGSFIGIERAGVGHRRQVRRHQRAGHQHGRRAAISRNASARTTSR